MKRAGYAVSGILDRIGGEVGISGGGLNLCVAEELTDHRQALTGGNRRGGEGMAQVVDSDVFDAGALADAPPRRLQIG